jgi:hypothetical protein
MGLDMHVCVLEERNIDESMMSTLNVGQLIDFPPIVAQELCYWRKNYKLNEFISEHIYKKRNHLLNADDFNGAFLILTYQDILLIEKNIKEIEIHPYVSIDIKEIKKKNKVFIDGAKAALDSGKVVVYYGRW